MKKILFISLIVLMSCAANISNEYPMICKDIQSQDRYFNQYYFYNDKFFVDKIILVDSIGKYKVDDTLKFSNKIK